MVVVSRREVDALENNDELRILDRNMSAGTTQKLKIDSQDVANRATPNQLTVPEVTNLVERPIERRDNDQPELNQAEKETENVDKDVLTSKEIKTETSAEKQNPVEGDLSQNNNNLSQTVLPDYQDGQSADPKSQKETGRGSIQSSVKDKEILPPKGDLPPFPTISIVSPQGEERVASLDREDEEENQYQEETSGEMTKASGDYSDDKFIEEETSPSVEPSSNLFDKDSDDGSVTDDQRRALLELERQQKETDNLVLPAFEGNIKNRLHQLNQELANEEPQKPERTPKVAFKEDLVEVISPTKAAPDTEIVTNDNGLEETQKDEDQDKDLEPTKDWSKVSESNLEAVFDMVVERDGHFDVVTPEDMTASADKRKKLLSLKEENTQHIRNRTRPTSAITTSSTCPFRIPDSRPVSCPIYNSPYGLTQKQKELARKKMAMQEKAKREEEEARKLQEKQRRMQNEEAFQCWLKRTRENEQAARKKVESMSEMQRKENEEKENQQKKLSDEKFQEWVQSKSDQQKQEELFKYQENQIYQSFLQPRSREESEHAFRCWLKKKSQETKRQKYLAKQRYRLQQRLLRRSRLIRNMTWDVYLNNSFHFTDHYALG